MLCTVSARQHSLLTTVLCTGICIASAIAQPYPTKPIRLVLPVAPGGGADVIARTVSQKVGAALGQPFVIDNRGGADGNIAAEIVAKSPPDGHTIGMVLSSHTINVSLYKKINYEVNGWYGWLVPAGTPQNIIALLHDEAAKAIRMNDVRERLTADGAVPVGSTPEEFARFIQSETVKWAKVVKLSGATAE